ncbi:MAG: cell division protein SepF [Actinobacteria bacterium]|nr:MAG: cell division protein SepF [Actinomycetota bacterium]
MSMFRRAMDYLGLGPDDAYDDYDASVAVERPAARNTRGAGASRRPQPQPYRDGYGDEYEDDVEDDIEVAPRARNGSGARPAAVRAQGQRDDSSVQLRPSGASTGGTVKKLTQTTAEPVLIRPTRYDQAKDIADLLKSGQPVAMNIGAADSEIARRLIDFASGVIYGIEGQMEKIAPGVFLLTPRGTRVIRD